MKYLPFRITVDGKPTTPKDRADERVVDQDFDLWANNFEAIQHSGVFEIAQPGDVELVITAAAKGDGWTVFDDIHVTSVNAILESGFGTGQALGNVAESNYAKMLNEEDSFARSFGLAYVGYEGGWSLGGDLWQTPLQNWCKLKEERAKGINDTAEDLFRRAGGFMNVWGVYAYWPAHDVAGAASYPLWRSIAGAGARLPAEPANGIVIPGRVEPKDIVRDWDPGADRNPGVLAKRGDWRAWLVLAPKSGRYALSVQAQGDGEWELEVDGVAVGRGGGSAGASPMTVSLVRGQHGLRLRNRGGEFTLQAIQVQDADNKDGK